LVTPQQRNIIDGTENWGWGTLDIAPTLEVGGEPVGPTIHYPDIGLPVALGLLYPFFGILLSPLLAAIAMSFSSVTVISNANRLKRWKPRAA
jgi:hypothetical protein